MSRRRKTPREQAPVASAPAKPLPSYLTVPASSEGIAPFLSAAIVLATLLAYANSFSGVFLFDDRLAILENATIRSLLPVWRPFWGPMETSVAGRPLLNFSFALNHAISGYQIWSYHAFNLAIHVGGALALYGLIRATFRMPAMRRRAEVDPSFFAFAVALLWALHPMQTESVTYIIARSEALAGLFCLLALYAFARSVESPSPMGWGAASFAACLLGVVTKETAATAPVLVLLYDRCFVAGSFAEALRRRGTFYGALACAWIPLAAIVATGPRSLSAGSGAGSHGPMDYFLNQATIVLRYFRLSVWPHPLVFDYGWALPGPPTGYGPSLAAELALVAASIWALRVQPALGFLGASVFIFLSVTSSFMPIAEPCWEYRMSFPLASVLALGALAAHRGIIFAGEGLELDASRRRLAAVALLAGIAVAYGVATAVRNADYRSEITLLEKSLELYPVNPRGLNSLGGRYMKELNAEAAADRFQKAIYLHPNFAEAHANLAVPLLYQKKLDEARASLERAIALKPDFPQARNILCMVLLDQGKPREALEQADLAIRMAPGMIEARINRSRALQAMGRAEEAQANLAETSRLFPGDPFFAQPTNH